MEDEDIEKQTAKLADAKSKENAVNEISDRPYKPNMSFDDFLKMDLRVGTIKTAEKVKKADKLLELSVDMGNEIRTIVSGIAQHYSPEDVIGQQVSVLCNLEPRKIRGVESQGMILMAEDDEGNLVFVSPKKAFQSGAEIR